jgi:hypothetical protein
MLKPRFKALKEPARNVPEAAMIDTGLVIAPPWIELILAGKKTWEIRRTSNKRCGRIALCKKRGPIVATCIIGASVPLPRGEFERHFDRHRVTLEQLEEFYGDKARSGALAGYARRRFAN